MFLLLVAHNRRVMVDHPIGRVMLMIGWGAAILVTTVSLYFLWQQIGGLILPEG